MSQENNELASIMNRINIAVGRMALKQCVYYRGVGHITFKIGAIYVDVRYNKNNKFISIDLDGEYMFDKNDENVYETENGQKLPVEFSTMLENATTSDINEYAQGLGVSVAIALIGGIFTSIAAIYHYW